MFKVVPDVRAVAALDAASEGIRKEKKRLQALQKEYTMKRDQFLAAELIMKACKEVSLLCPVWPVLPCPCSVLLRQPALLRLARSACLASPLCPA